MAEINVSAIAELLNNKADTDLNNTDRIFMKSCTVNGESGCIVWSNGYCRQWGRSNSTSTSTVLTVTYYKAFKDTNYSLFVNSVRSSVSGSFYPNVRTLTTTGFTYVGDSSANNMWEAAGFLPDGSY